MARDKSGSNFSLKDHLFNPDRVHYLASLLQVANKSFDPSGFTRATLMQLGSLELKARIVHIACMLEKFLAADYPAACQHILAALPPPLDPSQTDDDFGDFIFAPLGEFVVRNGMHKSHLKLSFSVLQALTQRFSMEDALRAFLNTHPTETLRQLESWADHDHYHVRRLVSEGTRPLLPWSKRLSLDPLATIPLLERLHADPTRYVTRSVANHLNDLAKSHPDVVLALLLRWRQLEIQEAAELRWMSQHALRTLVKQGHTAALQFLGFRLNPKVEVAEFVLAAQRIKAGEAIEFSFTLTGLRDESLMVDYVIDFVKASGKLAAKVHKLKQIRLKKNEAIRVSKRHLLKADATTYTLYPGIHHLTLQINGKAFGTQTFELH